MHQKTQKIVLSSLMAALVCVATMMIKVPSPMKGYLNLGDGFVLITAWLLSPFYGFLAAGLGSALADLFSGYIVYAPATFLIKGAMALIAFAFFLLLKSKLGIFSARLVGAVMAELMMVAGYFVFEGFMYGFVPSAVNIPANAVQGAAGIVIGMVFIKAFLKIDFGDR